MSPRRSIAVAVAVAVAASVAMSAVPASAASRTVHVSAPCRYEDGSGQRFCYWNARAQGNGRGESFVSLDGGKRAVYMRAPNAPVTARNPLVVRDVNSRATVIHGRTVLAKNAPVVRF